MSILQPIVIQDKLPDPSSCFFSGALIISETVNASSIIALIIILCGIALTRFRSNQLARSS